MKKKKFGTGLHPTPPDNRDFGLADFYKQPDLDTIPDGDWGEFEPAEIKDQQQTQECTGHGVVAALEPHEDVILNPSWQYAAIKELMGDPSDSGADLRMAMKSGLKAGAIEKTICNIGTDEYDGDFLADIKNYPDVKEQAKIHQQRSFFDANQGRGDTFDRFRSWLWYFKDEKGIIVTGTVWRDSWTYSKGGIISKEESTITGGHCIAILPVQKNIAGEMYLKVQNSYGLIGDKGCFWFPRDVINRDFKYGGYIFRDKNPALVKKYYEIKNQIINEKTMAEEPSVRYQFNTEEGNKVFKSLLISLAGFVLVKLVELLGQFDFGQFSTLVAALSPFLVNSIKLFVQGTGAEVLGKKK